MREVMAVCRSTGKSRKRVALVLDRYLMRIGDRTWRGYASNQCLDRISSDLRACATRATAVSVHGFGKSDMPERVLFQVGRRSRFGEPGQAPIATHGRGMSRPDRSGAAGTMRALIRISAMFHDIGKATRLFQTKLRDAIAGRDTVPDALRHELVSALCWDALCGMAPLDKIGPQHIDEAMFVAARRGLELHQRAVRDRNAVPVHFDFLQADPATRQIGLLVLGHHRQPDLAVDACTILADNHLNPESPLSSTDLEIAAGMPYWHEPGWINRLHKEFSRIEAPEECARLMDLHGRTALMLADHFGSSRKAPHPDGGIGHIANSTKEGNRIADSLSMHVRRVTDATRSSCDALIASRHDFPGLLENEIPQSIRFPSATGRFGWQGLAARQAAGIVSSGEGGFFGCLLAGTGTGKTRAAPGILAAATFADVRPERRSLRFTLGLGLRVLATQSGAEYLDDLGFSARDVSVIVGSPPIDFSDAPVRETGSADMLGGLDPLDVVPAKSDIPSPGDPREQDWLLGLSHDVDRRTPAFIDMLADEDDRFRPGRGSKLRKLARSPIICATVDNVIAAASPERSRHLPATVRVLSSDLILDDIDQYSAEDISVLVRLAYLTGASGRRMIIMSATVTPRIAQSLFEAYRSGWSAYASAFDIEDRVHFLCASEAEGGLSSSAETADFADCFADCSRASVAALDAATPRRMAELLPVESLDDLPGVVSMRCSLMHDRHAIDLDGFRLSVGFVRMTRIAHTVRVAAMLPDPEPDRIRLNVCLHSKFTALGRGWIESRLKAALTRKGENPHAGLRDLCVQERVFERARAAGVRDIEIVLVCSPVIETGNDLDFDYAILDPSSTRSVVQAAGRIRRHRFDTVRTPNVAVLDRPLVTFEGRGLIEMPGVETRPHEQTGIAALSVLTFGANSRNTPDLLGSPGPIDARMIFGEQGMRPLPLAEDALVGSYLDGRYPVSDWVREDLRRHCCAQSRARRFRRSTTRRIVAWQDGDGLDDLAWYWDRLPGRRDPVLNRCEAPAIRPGVPLKDALFTGDILERSWNAAYGEAEVGSARARRVLAIDMEYYGDGSGEDPDLVYHETMGLTKPVE
jgi:CRISPR-associated endonuclease/helicase Cas3